MVVSQPSRKNKDAARVGHPDSTPYLKRHHSLTRIERAADLSCEIGRPFFFWVFSLFRELRYVPAAAERADQAYA
jgi:hypothetical protein